MLKGHSVYLRAELIQPLFICNQKHFVNSVQFSNGLDHSVNFSHFKGIRSILRPFSKTFQKLSATKSRPILVKFRAQNRTSISKVIQPIFRILQSSSGSISTCFKGPFTVQICFCFKTCLTLQTSPCSATF